MNSARAYYEVMDIIIGRPLTYSVRRAPLTAYAR